MIIDWGIPGKNQTGGAEDKLFWKPTGIFFTLPLEIPDETKLHPWKFYKMALDLLEIPSPIQEIPWTPGNSTLFSWSPLEIQLAISLIILEIPYPHPLPPFAFGCFLFSGIAHLKPASWLPTYLAASCVVYNVPGSHQPSGGILVWWPNQCISRKISLDFSFWFLMRISRIFCLRCRSKDAGHRPAFYLKWHSSTGVFQTFC